MRSVNKELYAVGSKGLNTKQNDEYQLVQVMDNVDDMAVGYNHVGCINQKQLFMWGSNQDACLGISSSKKQFYI